VSSVLSTITVLTIFVLSVSISSKGAAECNPRDLGTLKVPTLRQAINEIGAEKGDFIQYNKTNLDNSLMYPRVGRITLIQGNSVHLILEPHRMANGKLSSRYRTTLDKSDYPQNVFVLNRPLDLSSWPTLEDQIGKVKPEKGDLIQFNKINSTGGLTEPLVGRIVRFNKSSMRILLDPRRTENDHLSLPSEETINFDETVLNLIIFLRKT
jgi:hypothetical protein